MKYGFVEYMQTVDRGKDVKVAVDFVIDRSVLYEFMDCLKPIDGKAMREPILAILEHSAVEVDDDR